MLGRAQARECQALLADIREEEEALLPQCPRASAQKKEAVYDMPLNME